MRCCAIVLLALAATACLTGCQRLWIEPATLYADTLTAEKDGFTNRSPQYAYEGEPVTFDFAPDLAATDYAVFLWPDGTGDCLDRQDLVMSYFRGVGVFKAGDPPRRNLVQAVAYAVRGKSDWFYDKDADEWVYHSMRSDEPDWKVGEVRMEIYCYRVDIDIPFGGGQNRVKDVVLTLSKDDGTQAVRRIRIAPGEPGLDIVGPDAGGKYHARYTPRYSEVNRVGTTDVELAVAYDDGSRETIPRTIDTP